MVVSTLSPPRKRREAKLPDGVDLKRLTAAMIRDRSDLEPFRRFRREAVRQLGGKNYSDDCAPLDVPINMIGLYTQIIVRALIAQHPRVMYSTFERDQQAAVSAMEQWANDEIVRMNAVESYARVFNDALFSMGILKVCLATPVDAAMNAWETEAGQPMLGSVDLDDWGCDMTAMRFDQCGYHFCRYRTPVRVANELYAKGKADKFEADVRSDYNQSGDERIQGLTGTRGYREEFEDHCDLWEVFDARNKSVYTLRDAAGVPDDSKGPVRVQRWIGPSCGPYHYLGFGIMPGNLMPKAPIMDLMPLHLSINNGYRKLLRQTRDAKRVTPYRGGNTEDAKRLRDEPDGGMFQCDNPEALREIEVGAPLNTVLTMTDHMRQAFDFVGGNLNLLGGRGPQSRTATQDRLLNENASAGVSNLQDAAIAFVQRTMEAMNWYWWNHPTKVMKSQWSPSAMPGMKLTRSVAPDQRRGPMPHIKVDPYSLPRQTPQNRLAFINQVLQTVGPMMGLLQQQGVGIDMNALLDIFAKYGDEPNLGRIFRYVEPPSPADGSASEGAGGPPTHSIYERRSSGGGQDQQPEPMNLEMGQEAMSGPVNPNGGPR